MFTFEDGKSYRMPAHFGGSPFDPDARIPPRNPVGQHLYPAVVCRILKQGRNPPRTKQKGREQGPAFFRLLAAYKTQY